MKINKYLAACLLLTSFFTWADTKESCSEMKKINGVLTDVPVACGKFDRPVPCTKTTTDAKGWQIIETVPCAPGMQKTVQQVEREELAAKRKLCGKDFQAMRIGMTLARFEECTDGLVFETETVSKGGSVEIYRSTFHFIHAKDGRIVSYTRRNN